MPRLGVPEMAPADVFSLVHFHNYIILGHKFELGQRRRADYLWMLVSKTVYSGPEESHQRRTRKTVYQGRSDFSGRKPMPLETCRESLKSRGVTGPLTLPKVWAGTRCPKVQGKSIRGSWILPLWFRPGERPIRFAAITNLAEVFHPFHKAAASQ